MGIPTRFYKEAEEKVVDLLVDCGMMRFPVDPFFLARMKGIEVRDYSVLDAEKNWRARFGKLMRLESMIL